MDTQHLENFLQILRQMYWEQGIYDEKEDMMSEEDEEKDEIIDLTSPPPHPRGRRGIGRNELRRTLF